MLCLCCKLPAQTIDESNAYYKEFVGLINTSTDKDKIFDALYRCYTATSGVLNSPSTNSVAYRQAYNNMRDIVRYLPNGAAYCSSARKVSNAVLFAKAYVDVAVRPDFAEEGLTTTPSFAQLSYYAASNLVNSRNYKDAVTYLQAYIRSGEEKFRKSVFINLSKACVILRDYKLAMNTLDEAIRNYPSDYDIISIGVNMCIDNGDNDNLQRYVTKALALRPTDSTLLNIQGKLYEENRQFDEALKVYTSLHQTNPHAIDVVKHLAVNTYNIGVLNYNSSLSEQDKSELEKEKAAYTEYFNYAIGHLKDVVQAEPSSLKYTEALAVAYKCIDELKQMEIVNNKLASMGGGRISSNVIPTLLSYSGEGGQNTGSLTASSHSARPSHASSSGISGSSSSQPSDEIPPYSVYAKQFIEPAINEWQQKDPYETISEYQTRVTEKTRDAKIKELMRKAEKEYIARYQSMIDLGHLELKPYDAENGVFLITSDVLGEMIVPVPRTNNEARLFESSWSGMQFKDPKYFIENDHLAIANLTFVTPTGKQYQYDNDAALNYTETYVEVNFKPIENNFVAANEQQASSKQTVSKQSVSIGASDVDMNIPEIAVDNSRSFAVIIANEEYYNVAGVPMALNDGITFSKYCKNVLGMPEPNIRLYKNASFGMMLRAVRDIKSIADAYNGDISIVFYYAGHGIPNESTKDAYLLPVDADGTQTEGCYSLNRLYSELGSTSAKSIVVFLDACFSGSKREEGMLASARGVALKVKKEDPRGNMVVFSAASDDETAFPYTGKGHGLFTYFLLKKLQETEGDVTLGELSDYITSNVKQQSVVINHKPQTPSATPSESLQFTWKDIRLRPAVEETAEGANAAE